MRSIWGLGDDLSRRSALRAAIRTLDAIELSKSIRLDVQSPFPKPVLAHESRHQ